ncbi:MAG: polysaccharide biosynthesis/export family protein [Candidatus Acidiferrales bacterium]
MRTADAQQPPTPLLLQEYRIGPEDLLEISVFEAQEMNRQLRVSASGEISLPLVGAVKAAGLTAQELEVVLQELLRRTIMKDPHVGVYVREMQSHTISVFGAVKKPGVFQIRGARTLLEVLSMAEGLADEAGDSVLVMRGASLPGASPGAAAASDPPSGASEAPASVSRAPSAADWPSPDTMAGQTVTINLKSLLESGDPASNVAVYPGDIVKVTRAGVIYVVGEVKKAGGFVLRQNENISVLQALALAEGLNRTAARRHARIIRTDETTGARSEIPIDLSQVLAGKATDPLLQPRDIVFVPNSAARSALYRTGEAAISIVTGVIVWRR